MTSELEKLRSTAKRLKKAFAAGDPEAASRVHTTLPDAGELKHADFLHIVARENGHESWPKLKFAFEAGEMTRDQRAERLKMALYFGQRWVVEKLLSADPDLTRHNLGLQIATYDLNAVTKVMEDPSAATRVIGVRSPILHLAYSKYIHMAPERREDMLAIADLLVRNGADPNDGYASDPGSDHKISALYGALGHANNLALAEWLLDHGATPDDDESLYHATELGHHDGLKLLIKHGVRTSGTNALPRALDFDDLEAVRLLLEHGADPNEAVTGHPSGEPVDSIPALHQAARRWCSGDVVRLLLEHGGDATAIWKSHTPYGLARIYGNVQAAEVLEGLGHATPLTPSEEALTACAEGVAPGNLVAAENLSEEERLLLTRIAATPGRLDHLKALIAAGLDPNRPQEMGMLPLHIAGWEGLPEHVAYLLSLSPDLKHRNDYGGDALGTVIHGAEHCPDAGARNHIACARLLLESGAELRPQYVESAGTEDMAAFLEGWEKI